MKIKENYICALRWRNAVGRALHRYRRGHGFKSRTGLNFFSGLILSSVHSCEDFLYSFLHGSAHIWFSYIYNHYSSLGWFIWTQHNDQLPVSLLAKLVELCISIAEVMGSNPIQARIFFFPGLISTTSSVVFIAAKYSCVLIYFSN